MNLTSAVSNKVFAIMFVLFLLFAAPASADESAPASFRLSCQGSSSYLNLTYSFIADSREGIRGIGDMVMHPTFIEKDGSRVKLHHSQSECEDVTTLEFDAGEFQALLGGRMVEIDGTLIQDEPNLRMELWIHCVLQKI